MSTDIKAVGSEPRYEIGGNWKMNFDDPDKATELAADVFTQVFRHLGGKPSERLGVTLFVPAQLFSEVARTLNAALKQLTVGHDDPPRAADFVGLGFQNMYWKPSGAYTGELSPTQIVGISRKFGFDPNVLVGHSERRLYFGETDLVVNGKMLAAIEYGVRPTLCIGETLKQRKAGVTGDTLWNQITSGLADIPAAQFMGAKTIVAYEPVWAIGTGETATPQVANETQGMVRGMLADHFGSHDMALQTTIQYGGSMKPTNAPELLAQGHINGGLIGGASLNPSFVGIVKAVPIAV